MEESAVRATKALYYNAKEAVAVKFADRIGELDDALAEYSVFCSTPSDEANMSTTNKAVEPTAEQTAALATARTEGEAAGSKAGVTAERTRFKAIMALPEAKGHEAQAQYVALETDMTVDQAKGFLAGLPAVAAPAAPAETKPAATATEPAADSAAPTPFDNANEGGTGVKPGAAPTNSAEAASAEPILNLAAQVGIPGLRSSRKERATA
jgi:hypothetical protein